MGVIQVFTTTPTESLAEEIAGRLIEERLAACVHIDGPIRSVYRWEGKVERDQEWRLTAKTDDACFSRVEQAIRDLHPFDVPEILAVPIVQGSQEYLNWLAHEVNGG